MNELTYNMPLLLLVAWFSYKWWNSRRIQKLLPDLKSQGAILIDVRTEAEFKIQHAPETINIPLQQLSSRLGELPNSRPIILCCASGTRSGMAKLLLKKKWIPKGL